MPKQQGKAPGLSGSSINAYLTGKGSPMNAEGTNLMAVGRQFDVDPRLLVAIAGAETGFGRNVTSGANNAWNWRYNGSNSPFVSWLTGMTSVAKGLTKPRSVYDLSSTTLFYAKFCHGDCSEGLRNLGTFMREQGADVNALGFPEIGGGGE